jgi:4'-phosphopantetheinyl transferase
MTIAPPAPVCVSEVAPPLPADGELHVWQATLDPSEEELAELVRVLSDDERKRAARFRFKRDRRRFLVGRGILRRILGGYLRRPPNELTILYGLRAKPFLAGTPLHFNLSHSGPLAVVAVARSGAVGVDIEYVRPVPDCEIIMKSFFSQEEIQTIGALPPVDRLLAFFTCWTRKEAYRKARGDGMTTPLDCFSVTAVPGSPPRLLHVEGEPRETARWSFADLPLEKGYVGVVALEGTIQSVRDCFWRGG